MIIKEIKEKVSHDLDFEEADGSPVEKTLFQDSGKVTCPLSLLFIFICYVFNDSLLCERRWDSSNKGLQIQRNSYPQGA